MKTNRSRQAAWLASVKSSAAALIVAASASACVVVPVVDMRADVSCDLTTRQVTLDVQQIAALGGCYGDACLAQLVVGGVVFATSLVVSGSVAIVGNTLHWIERVRKCGRDKAQDWPQAQPLQTPQQAPQQTPQQTPQQAPPSPQPVSAPAPDKG
jgi:hypothetical protein